MKSKKQRSNEARLLAVQNLAERRCNHQKIIQESLKTSLVENPDKSSNHIIFDSDEDEEINDDDLLGFGNDDADVDHLKIKPQFEGKGGKKLMELQSKIGFDPRFQLDERFAEEEEEQEEEEQEEEEDQEEKEVTHADELKNNLNILEQVVGTKKLKNLKKSVKFMDINKQRYDPGQEGHDQFQIKNTEEKPKKKKKKISKSSEPAPEVDKKRFYEVNYNQLQQAFSEEQTDKENKAAAFSLSALFDVPSEVKMKDETDDEDEDMNVGVNEEEAPKIDTSKFSHFVDSSEDEEERYKPTTTTATVVKQPKLGKLDKVRETIWSVNRKVFEANPVILEQALIFKSNRNEKEKFERWSEIKEFLQKDFRKKHKDYMKSSKTSESGNDRKESEKMDQISSFKEDL